MPSTPLPPKLLAGHEVKFFGRMDSPDYVQRLRKSAREKGIHVSIQKLPKSLLFKELCRAQVRGDSVCGWVNGEYR